MKKKIWLLLMLLLAAFIDYSCMPSPPSEEPGIVDPVDPVDPLPVINPATAQVGEWIHISLQRYSSYLTGVEHSFSFTIPAAGRYVIETRNVPSGYDIQELWCFFISPSAKEGQSAYNSENVAAGPRTALLRNTSTQMELNCEARVVLLSESALYIPNEGTLTNPVELQAEVTHNGKVGCYSLGGGFGSSYYKIIIPETGTYRFAFQGIASMYTGFTLYSDAFITQSGTTTCLSTEYTWLDRTDLQAGSVWYIKVTDLSSYGIVPVFTFEVFKR